MTSVHRITASHAPDGVYDIANPGARPIDMAYVAHKLARLVRFTGEPGAIPVAQHAVLGAEAIIAEGGEAFEAVLFLHHDDHEFILGDQSRPLTATLGLQLPGFAEGWAALKSAWDGALYAALNLPPPEAWTSSQTRRVANMDMRMCAAEARALFGPAALTGQPAEARRTPRFNGHLAPPWPAEKAASAFLAMHRKLTGVTIR